MSLPGIAGLPVIKSRVIKGRSTIEPEIIFLNVSLLKVTFSAWKCLRWGENTLEMDWNQNYRHLKIIE